MIEHNMSKESTRQFIYVEIGITTVYCLVIPTNDKILYQQYRMTYIYHCVMKLFGGAKGYTVIITGDGGKEGMGVRLRSSDYNLE